jgi:hypothetical protein
MTESNNNPAYQMLSDDHPAVQQVLRQAGVAPVSNKDKAKPAGSRKNVMPTVVETDAALESKIKEAEEPKTVSITLSARDYALMLREAVGLKKSVEQHLQDVVADMMLKRLGKATINKVGFMTGKKVTGVTNSVKRQ